MCICAFRNTVERVMKMSEDLNSHPTAGLVQLGCSDQLISPGHAAPSTGEQRQGDSRLTSRRFSMADGGGKNPAREAEGGRGNSAPPPPPFSTSVGHASDT